MATKNIRTELDKLSKDRLVNILARLHETDRKAHVLIQSELKAGPKTGSADDGEGSSIFDAYKVRIKKELLQKNPEASRLVAVKKIIREASTGISDKEQVMLLMLFAVEQGIDALFKHGDKNEEFSTGIADMFYNVLESMGRKGLLEKYKKQCSRLARNAKAGGDDFSSEMLELYDEFFDAG